LPSAIWYSAKKSHRHVLHDTRQRLPFCRVSAGLALDKPPGPFASPFAECSKRHSAKALSLPSTSWTSSRQREHQWTPLPVSFSSALRGTRQRFSLYRVPAGLALGNGSTSGLLCQSLCRVPQPHHSAKKVYRFSGVPSLPSAIVTVFGKVTLYRV
jgi:hypothetical protein